MNTTGKRIGRPPRPDGPTVRISTRVPGAVAEGARKVAEAEGTTLSEMVRRAVVEYVIRYGEDERDGVTVGELVRVALVRYLGK